MKPAQFAAIRERLGLSAYAFARALGYEGNRNTLQVIVARFESGNREIPTGIARLAMLLDERKAVPKEFMR